MHWHQKDAYFDEVTHFPFLPVNPISRSLQDLATFSNTTTFLDTISQKCLHTQKNLLKNNFLHLYVEKTTVLCTSLLHIYGYKYTIFTFYFALYRSLITLTIVGGPWCGMFYLLGSLSDDHLWR